MRVPADRLKILRNRENDAADLKKTPSRRFPPWLRAPLPGGARYAAIKKNLRDKGLHTVCEEAQCPNIGECWNEGTATLMLMGDTCTRACRFCAVKTAKHPPPLDADEPHKAAVQVQVMALDYVVLTSVNRDDMADGGAEHFAASIRAIRELNPDTLVEVLTPDFQGNEAAIRTVVEAQPHVFAHNIETVEALQGSVRDKRASWQQSLDVLAYAKQVAPKILTKSSIMLGLHETEEHVDAALVALRAHGVDAVTLGQYLRPSPWHHEVIRFVEPAEFERWDVRARALGFRYCASGPMVRSSYRAGEHYLAALVADA